MKIFLFLSGRPYKLQGRHKKKKKKKKKRVGRVSGNTGIFGLTECNTIEPYNDWLTTML